jgi:hypothetical protein
MLMIRDRNPNSLKERPEMKSISFLRGEERVYSLSVPMVCLPVGLHPAFTT